MNRLYRLICKTYQQDVCPKTHRASFESPIYNYDKKNHNYHRYIDKFKNNLYSIKTVELFYLGNDPVFLDRTIAKNLENNMLLCTNIIYCDKDYKLKNKIYSNNLVFIIEFLNLNDNKKYYADSFKEHLDKTSFFYEDCFEKIKS